MDDRHTDGNTEHGRNAMDNAAPAPTAPPQTENRITHVEELVVLPTGAMLLADKFQREVPRLPWEVCVELARLQLLYGGRPADQMTLAIEQHAAERQYSHGGFDGWREACR